MTVTPTITFREAALAQSLSALALDETLGTGIGPFVRND